MFKFSCGAGHHLEQNMRQPSWSQQIVMLFKLSGVKGHVKEEMSWEAPENSHFPRYLSTCLYCGIPPVETYLSYSYAPSCRCPLVPGRKRSTLIEAQPLLVHYVAHLLTDNVPLSLSLS
jgi:hypothetical protein